MDRIFAMVLTLFAVSGERTRVDPHPEAYAEIVETERSAWGSVKRIH